jgi:hypothetical protein
MAQIPFLANRSYQSQHLYLQAAGSRGTDGSVRGIYLRWDLTDKLGELHLAKGDYASQPGPYATTAGYNKSKDFVSVWRTCYTTYKGTQLKLTLSSRTPTLTRQVGNYFEWEYQGIELTAGNPATARTIVLRFWNSILYNALISSWNPLANAGQAFGFLKSYSDFIEADLLGERSFRSSVQLSFSSTNAQLKMELVSRGKANPVTGSVSLRKNYSLNNTAGPVVEFGENISYLRWITTGGTVETITFELYGPYIEAVNNVAKWTKVNDFALSLDNNLVLNQRLQQTGVWGIDSWPHFNDGAQARFANFSGRWTQGNGLKTGVESYMQNSLSAANLSGEVTLPDDNDPNNNIQLSTMDALRMGALDFHVARMLGLGHIDRVESSSKESWCISFANQGEHVLIKNIAAYTTGLKQKFSAEIWISPELDPNYFPERPAGQLKSVLEKWVDRDNRGWRISAVKGINAAGQQELSVEVMGRGLSPQEYILFSCRLAGPHLWYQLVMTKNGPNPADWILYINNIPNPGRVNGSSTICDNVASDAPIVVNGQKHIYIGYADALRVYKTALTAAEVTTIWNRGRCYRGTVFPIGLIGHWPFDQSQGLIAPDISSNANNGKLIQFASVRTNPNGGAWIPAACCATAKTNLVLIEPGAHISIPIATKSKLTEGTFTNLFWLSMDANDSYSEKEPETSLKTIMRWAGPSIKSPENARATGGFEVRMTRGAKNEKGTYPVFSEVKISDARTGKSFRFTTSQFVDTEWMHVVLRRGKSKTIDGWHLLINGQEGKRTDYADAGTTVSYVATVAPLQIGNLEATNRLSLDNVQLSSKFLSDEEIMAIYKAGNVGDKSAPSLIGWWKLDESSGLVLNDSSKNAINAAIEIVPIKDVTPITITIPIWTPLDACSTGCADESAKYIYLAEYTTLKAIPDFTQAAIQQHFFMSLPTAMTDERLPVNPAAINPITYGLSLPGSGGPMPAVTDPDGYSFYEDIRFINVDLQPYPQEIPFEELVLGNQLQRFTGFFNTPAIFNLAEVSLPVCHGIDYKLDTGIGWRKPELLNDPNYTNDTDSLGQPVPEPKLIPVNDLHPLYLHQEREEGIHLYAPYAVNWFNRTRRGSPVATNYTKFKKKNRLLPPLNFAVQYIQKEDPRILTSLVEQNMLDARITGGDPDPNFTRATFRWNQIHNTAYQYANFVEFWFRRTLPMAIQGQIVAITPLANNEFRVDTGPYTIYSTANPTVISPSITSGDELKFAGSLLATNANETYEVIGITNPGSNAPYPSFIVKGNLTQSTTSNGSNTYQSGGTISAPAPAQQFLLTENMQNEINWEQKLVKQVGIPATSGTVQLQNYSEVVFDDNGNPTTLHIGGVFDNATFNPVPGSPGVYEITYGINLLPPIDPDVNWYQGGVRISNNFTTYDPADIRDLDVLRITNLSPLTLMAYDADYTSHVAVMPSTILPTNFHPGYRVYLYPETVLFNGPNILPVPGTGTRTTYMAARSIDSVETLSSSFTNPVLLMAREIIVPEPPEPPRGGKFATRADVYGKSTYTFDSKVNTVNRTPYGFVFYRASDNILLNTLWEALTAETIMNELANLPEPSYRDDYWIGLVNMELQSDQFKVYGTGLNTFQLPNPDKAPLFNGSNITGDPMISGTYANTVRTQMLRAFVSLTEQPVLYPYLKTGLETEKKKPRILDANGQMLAPDLSPGSLFDPYPMVRKYVDGADTNVRFTDYTLDGALHGRVYFYYGVEIGQDWKKSDVAGVAGPVYILHVTPAKAPTVRRYNIVRHTQPDPVLHEVNFELNPYAESEKIKQILIYRAANEDDAKSLATMEKIGPFAIGQPLADTFAGNPYPPYEENIHYRIVALREISNEYNQLEYIPSEPSLPVILRISDDNIPVAPVPTATPGTVTPAAFLNVTIEWTRCCYKGTYHLYRMSSAGQWQLIHETPDTGVVMQYNGPETASLARLDSNGDPIYSRFLLRVVNASGLVSNNDATVIL